jgi:hypothetical protein
MSSRTLRLLAAVYLVKTLVVGLVWLSAPDLPRRAWERVRQTFSAQEVEEPPPLPNPDSPS